MEELYTGLASPALLNAWLADPMSAPGREVSSPWPDHIEVTAVERIDADRYRVEGFVVELTSYELTHGGAAARIPIELVVGRTFSGWQITAWSEVVE